MRVMLNQFIRFISVQKFTDQVSTNVQWRHKGYQSRHDNGNRATPLNSLTPDRHDPGHCRTRKHRPPAASN